MSFVCVGRPWFNFSCLLISPHHNSNSSWYVRPVDYVLRSFIELFAEHADVDSSLDINKTRQQKHKAYPGSFSTQADYLIPTWPSAGPRGGAGAALPAGIVNFIKWTTLATLSEGIVSPTGKEVLYLFTHSETQTANQRENSTFQQRLTRPWANSTLPILALGRTHLLRGSWSQASAGRRPFKRTRRLTYRQRHVEFEELRSRRKLWPNSPPFFTMGNHLIKVAPPKRTMIIQCISKCPCWHSFYSRLSWQEKQSGAEKKQ